MKKIPSLFLIGFLSVVISFCTYFFGVIIAPLRYLITNESFKLTFKTFDRAVVWYSGIPLIIGIVLILIDLFILLPKKLPKRIVEYKKINNPKITVVLTAYNDELSIGESVKDFLSHSMTQRVIVVDNNSKDSTAKVAKENGAEVFIESTPGYGSCVFRCLSEGLKYNDTDYTLLCEGDMTFRAHDIDKFLSYAPHVDIVNGTRIVEQLRSYGTQLSTFMFYGNFVVGKLLEVKHLGKGTFTDVGTTYKLCNNRALEKLLPSLNPSINLEFNAHFLDTALQNGFRIVECPITFYPRIGVSKGGNVNNSKAFQVGSRMLKGILFGWPK